MTNEVKQVMQNLRKNRMAVDYVATKAEVVPLVESLIPVGATIASGGSQSLHETGVTELMHSGKYHYLDRNAPNLTDEQRAAVIAGTSIADAYLCSSNAVTLNGELYNVDGNCNRISAIAFGPKKVILVVGVNKIVPDLKAAVRRVKTIAAPLNTQRLGCATYCKEMGHCMSVNGDMADGCGSPQRICCNYLVSGQQRTPDRIHVILVGEPCGY
ncbi:MAG: lactate utilization protein [Clostridia bacterium]|nr:lactate utilization protein [Clostridia bacterium]